jgi:hypothetical protein
VTKALEKSSVYPQMNAEAFSQISQMFRWTFKEPVAVENTRIKERNLLIMCEKTTSNKVISGFGGNTKLDSKCKS